MAAINNGGLVVSDGDMDSAISCDEDGGDVNSSPPVMAHISREHKSIDELKRIKCHRKTGRTLQLHIHCDHGHTEEAQKEFLIMVVSALPRLEHIEIVAPVVSINSRPPNRHWSVSLLTELLENAQSIVSVRLCCIKLIGTFDLFQKLGKSIRRLAALEKFILDKVSVGKIAGAPISTDANQGCWLGPVVSALATLPNLRHVRILGSGDFEHMTLTEDGNEHTGSVLQSISLRELCKSSSIRSLCLIHFNLSDDNVSHLAQQLETNVSLKELDIDCTLDKASSLALARLLERNSTLEDLNLCVRSKEDDTTPREEQMKEEDEVNHQLARGVGLSTLFNFALFRGKASLKTQEAFRAMIVHQLSLKSLTLYSGDEDTNEAFSADPTIRLYCKLNKYGRRRLLSDDAPGEQNALEFFTPELALVDTMGRVSDDLSCLFYFLSAKPSICNRAIQKLEQEERANLSRKRKSSRAPPLQAQPMKRTRLYRAAKYQSISYVE